MSAMSFPIQAPTLDRGGRRLPLRLLLVFGALTLMLGAIGVQVGRASGAFLDENARVVHALQVEQAIGKIVATLRDAEANQRAHMISGMPERLDDHFARLPELTHYLQRLATLVEDQPAQRAAATELTAAIEQRRRSMADSLSLYQKGGLDLVRSDSSFQAAREEDLAIDTLARRMLAVETATFEQGRIRSLRTARITRIATGVATTLCIAMLLVALALILREIKRRRGSEARLHNSLAELARSLEESLRLGETLRQFSDLGSMLQGCRSIDEATTGLRTSLARLLPDCAGSIQLIKASQNLVEEVVRWGDLPEGAQTLFLPDDCWALRRGQTHPIPGTLDAFRCKHLAGIDAADYLCVPLMAQGEMLGTLSLFGPCATSAATRPVAETAAEQVSLALANLNLQDMLRTQSLRDPLTGLFNRRYLEASFERELLRASRRELPLSMLMLDIDHFKRFNDSHGHEAGDTLLAQFGALLARLVRQEDVACRYGGEEFIVLLLDTDAPKAAERAEAVRAAVRELSVQHRRQTLGPVSVSIGIATYPRDGRQPAELLRSADRALYTAKHAGRDRVVSA